MKRTSKRHRIRGIAGGLFAAAVVWAGSVNARVIEIELPAGGTGCPAGIIDITTTSLTETLSVATITYDGEFFRVEKGEGISRRDSRKYCTIGFGATPPRGYRFAITQIHHDGYAEVPAVGSTPYYRPMSTCHPNPDRNPGATQ